MEKAGGLKTFFRKGKAAKEAPDLADDLRNPSSPDPTSVEFRGSRAPVKGALSGATDTGENNDPNVLPPNPRRSGKKEKVEMQYSRKIAPTKKEREAEAVQRYIAQMKAHFQSVDDFELAVEIATPGKRVKPQESHLTILDDNRPGSATSQGTVGDGEGVGQEGGVQLSAEMGGPLRLGPETPAIMNAAVLPDAKSAGHSGIQQFSGLHVDASVWDDQEQAEAGTSCKLLTPVQEDAGQEQGLSTSRTPSHSPSAACLSTSPGTQSQESEPSPPDYHPSTPQSSRISAYGLGSRRLSTCPQSDARRRSCIMPAGSKQTPAFMPPPERTLLSRISMRVSLGLSDALHRLGIMGAIPASHAGQSSTVPQPLHSHDSAVEDELQGAIWHGQDPVQLGASVPIPATPGGDYSEKSPAAEGDVIHEITSLAGIHQHLILASQGDAGLSEEDRVEHAADADEPLSHKEGSLGATIDNPVGPATPSVQAATTIEVPADATHDITDAVQQSREVPSYAGSDLASVALHVDTIARPQNAEDVATSLADSVRAALVLDDEDGDAASEEVIKATPLMQLLQLCNQPMDLEALPSMEGLLGQHVDLCQIQKIGEGTFGEAFRGGSVVFKIVPMEGNLLVNGEHQKRACDILAEVVVALTLSELRTGTKAATARNATSAFVETHGVGVCKGKYAADLTREWHAWDARHNSENDPVDAFPVDQLYIVFVVADGGIDLQHFEVRSFKEAKSILLQTALALAVAEEACEFEHRDLHWGNLLIRRVRSTTALSYRLRDTAITVQSGGLQVTLIDFTLSRLRSPNNDVVFCDMSLDPELFQGPKGDCQADTYRRMKKLTKNSWAGYQPGTNCLWLHYLADILLVTKLNGGSSDDLRALRNFRKRALTYKSSSDAAFDKFFEGMWLVDESLR